MTERGTFRKMTALVEFQCSDCKGTIAPNTEYWARIVRSDKPKPDPLNKGGEYTGHVVSRHCTDCVEDE